MEKKEYSVVEFIQYLKDKPYIKLYKAARLAEINMRREMRIKDTDTFVDLSKEDKDALDTWAHYCKQHEGYERNEEGN